MTGDAAAPGEREDDLDSLVRRSDPDRWLSSRFAGGPRAREDLVALYALDRELARIPRLVSEPLAGEIRFAWWREALAELDAGRGARGHPVLTALADAARRRGLRLVELEPLVDLHMRALDPEPFADETELREWLQGAAVLARAAVRVLDPAADPSLTDAAAQAWTLARTDFDGRVAFDPAELDALHASLFARARAEAGRLPPAAFPAVAHAALARRRSDRPGGLQARVRLILATATGRL